MLVVIPLDRVTGMVENIFPYLTQKNPKNGRQGEKCKVFFSEKGRTNPNRKKKCLSDYALGKTAKLSVNNLSNIKKKGKNKYNLFQQR